MKKTLLAVVFISVFTACNSDGKVNEKDLEAAGQKLQKTVEKGADTVGSKLKKLKNKIDDKLDTLKK